MQTTKFSSSESWVILSLIEQQIKEKIGKNGTPLKDWDIRINYGIKTGYNDAFIIDGAMRKEIIKQDPKSEEIIRPILRGRDIKKYGYDFADLWLINTHNGVKEKSLKRINIEDYPSVKKHMDIFFPQLEKRADKGDTPYNLRNCAYIEDFSKQKIVWARLMRISKNDKNSFPRFSLVPEDMYTVDSLCFITGDYLDYLVQILNSKVAAYYFFNNIAILDNGGMQMRQQYVENFPIPNLAEKFYGKIDVFGLYDFNEEEILFIDEFLKNKYKEIGFSEFQ